MELIKTVLYLRGVSTALEALKIFVIVVGMYFQSRLGAGGHCIILPFAVHGGVGNFRDGSILAMHGRPPLNVLRFLRVQCFACIGV